MSTDSLDSHREFARAHQLPFGLISDPQGRLAAAFGVTVTNGIEHRTTFVIDRHGRVARVFENVHPTGHADEVLAAVRAANGR